MRRRRKDRKIQGRYRNLVAGLPLFHTGKEAIKRVAKEYRRGALIVIAHRSPKRRMGSSLN
jgi:hypothetical protein